ncbi:hypothetical protein D3C71_1135560 [compost metagenome]
MQGVALLGTDVVAGQGDCVLDPGQGGGARDGGRLLHREVGHEDAGVAAVVVIRRVPEGVAVAQRLDHPLHIHAVHQVLVGGAATVVLGVLQHRIGVGAIDTDPGAYQAEAAGVEFKGEEVTGEQQHALTLFDGVDDMLFPFHLHQAAHPPVWPEPGHAHLEDGAAHALEVLFEQGFPLIPAELGHRQLQVATGNLDAGFQYLAGQGAELTTQPHLAAPGQQHQQPQQAQAEPAAPVTGMEQTGFEAGSMFLGHEESLVHKGKEGSPADTGVSVPVDRLSLAIWGFYPKNGGGCESPSPGQRGQAGSTMAGMAVLFSRPGKECDKIAR